MLFVKNFVLYFSIIILFLEFNSPCSALISEDLIDYEYDLHVVEYEDTLEFLNQLRNSATPKRLINTPGQNLWQSQKNWVSTDKGSYLRRVSNRFVGVKVYDKPKFRIGCCPLEPMNQDMFWNKMEGLLQGQYMYFNADSSLLDQSLQEDILPNFFAKTTPQDHERQDKTIITNVWMGSTGSTAALHYDPFDNFFVQIKGKKRFILFSPELHHSFYVYPKIHPAARQSQVGLFEQQDGKPLVLNQTTFPLLSNATKKGFSVTVEPGDVIYLPPYWFHQVESLEPAISVNTWINSPIIEKIDAAWSYSLPFSQQWTDEGFVLGAKALIRGIVSSVVVGTGERSNNWLNDDNSDIILNNFIKNLIDSRYTPLYGTHPTLKSDLMVNIVSSNDPHLRAHIREQSELDQQVLVKESLLPELEQICNSYPLTVLSENDELFEEALSNSIYQISKAFHPIEHMRELKILKLEDFVEDLIGQLVGDAYVYHYMNSCLIQRKTDENNQNDEDMIL